MRQMAMMTLETVTVSFEIAMKETVDMTMATKDTEENGTGNSDIDSHRVNY